MVLYRVRNWAELFENNRTRELKTMAWVPLPNKHDGDGYTELLDHKDGPAHYGAWVAIVQVASKCDPRGTLLRDSQKPHDARSLSRMTRFPLKVIEDAIERLIEIGWLEAISLNSQPLTDTSQDGAGLSQASASAPQGGDYGMEGNGMEQKGKKEGCSEPPKAASEPASEWRFPTVGTAGQEWALPLVKLNEFTEAFPGIEVAAELRKARQWCRDNATKRKTPKGMLKFLNRWLSRAQDGAGSRVTVEQRSKPAQKCRVPSDDELARWNPYTGGDAL